MTKAQKRNYFITVEGIEGAGKSTAMHFLQQLLTAANIPHIVTREPGGTEVAEKIRKVLLSHHEEKIAPTTELLLMFASRAQHLAQIIVPALKQGKWVLCDRFTDASYAYQGGGRQIAVEKIAQLENLVQDNLRPDLVLLLDIPVAQGFARIKKRCHDRIEAEQVEFFNRVRQAYLQRAEQAPQSYKIIDASKSLAEVEQQLAKILADLL